MMQQRLWSSTKLSFLITLVVMSVAVVLRIWQLSSIPSSPYWEETALGYDSYSLLKTGKDHHGTNWPIVAFESFGDWKPSGYFYAALPSIAVFGLSTFAVRLPSALAGVGIVWLFPSFFSLLFKKKLSVYETAWLRIIAAICPWLLVFSRAAWEVNLATFLLLAGSIFWLKALQAQSIKKNWLQAIVAVCCFAAAAYTYHALRIIAPLWAMGIGLDWLLDSHQKKSHFIKNSLQLLLWGTICVLLLLPIVLQLQNKAVSQRFQETSIFSSPDSVLTSNRLREEQGNTVWARVLHHRYRYQGAVILDKVLQHASFNFLFVTSDSNARHRGSMYGQLLYPDVALILLGILAVIYTRNTRGWLLGWLWFASVLPASVSTATPHALRTLPSALLWLSLSGYGFFTLKDWLFKVLKPPVLSSVILGAIVLFYVGFGWLWWHSYSTLYPVKFTSDWQYGYSQMIETTLALGKNATELPIVISRQQGRPAMFWWFYTKTDPKRVQVLDPITTKDQGEFLVFENIQFTRAMGDFKPNSIIALSEMEWSNIKKDHPSWELSEQSTIRNPEHEIVWLVGILKETK